MRILVVEDELKLGQAIKKGLEQDSYAVDLVRDAEIGQAYAETENYDVIVLDRMLPGGHDGLEICRTLRKSGNTTPVLILTALGEIEDRVKGLDDGADDYLQKPFSFDELLARLRALNRRPSQSSQPTIRVAGLAIDESRKQVTRGKTKLHLSRKEYALLVYFAHHIDQVLSKDQLIEHVWDFEATILPNTVEVFIRGLRQKIDIPNQDSLIETVRGFGYRLKAKA